MLHICRNNNSMENPNTEKNIHKKITAILQPLSSPIYRMCYLLNPKLTKYNVVNLHVHTPTQILIVLQLHTEGCYHYVSRTCTADRQHSARYTSVLLSSADDTHHVHTTEGRLCLSAADTTVLEGCESFFVLLRLR